MTKGRQVFAYPVCRQFRESFTERGSDIDGRRLPQQIQILAEQVRREEVIRPPTDATLDAAPRNTAVALDVAIRRNGQRLS